MSLTPNLPLPRTPRPTGPAQLLADWENVDYSRLSEWDTAELIGRTIAILTDLIADHAIAVKSLTACGGRILTHETADAIQAVIDAISTHDQAPDAATLRRMQDTVQAALDLGVSPDDINLACARRAADGWC